MDHHAYLLLGEKGARDAYLTHLLSREGVVLEGNPDVFVLEGAAFSVDDARLLSTKSAAKAFGSKKIFIINSERFSPESQNALLKTFEEPTPNTHFFILATEESGFLPTLLSRMQKVRVEGKSDGDPEEIKKFLALSYKDRIAFAKKFADKEKNLAEFLDSLLLHLRSKQTSTETLEKVFILRNFANDPAASPRLMLEHFSLTL